MLLLLISFLAGGLTVLAPCVLPLLPVIVTGSISGAAQDRNRPYIIAFSLAASIVFFTLILKVSTLLVNVSPDVLTTFSGGLLIALGLVTVFPEAWELLVVKLRLQPATLQLLGSSEQNRRPLMGPILIGLALGPVFSSCSPTYAFILASILPQSLSSGVVYLITYALGLVLALLGIAIAGRRLLSRVHWALDTHSLFRRLTGVLFILVGVAVFTGQEIPIETWVANHLPINESGIEEVLLKGVSVNHGSASSSSSDGGVLNVAPYAGPKLVGLTSWINSNPLTLSKLKGQVVLVDFWTYSCINCIRSIPYVEKWYQTYHSKGFEVIGVSTPEFAFEHVPANVAAAVKKDGITYPVALDNNYDTWNAFNNDSWPADYLIDKQGNVRYVSLGEGNYSTTEQAIQYLLGIRQPLTTAKFSVPISQNQTPETYFGTNREDDYVGSPQVVDGSSAYTPASEVAPDEWTLGGKWQINPQSITSESGSSTLTFAVQARNVYAVAGSSDNLSRTVKVTISSPYNQDFGADATSGEAIIAGSRLYSLVSLPQFGSATVKLTVPAGVSLYTFTFGS